MRRPYLAEREIRGARRNSGGPAARCKTHRTKIVVSAGSSGQGRAADRRLAPAAFSDGPEFSGGPELSDGPEFSGGPELSGGPEFQIDIDLVGGGPQLPQGLGLQLADPLFRHAHLFADFLQR